MSIANYALGNRALIQFILAMLVIGGIFSFYEMSKMEDPEIKVMQAMVLTTYPGASAHEVELQVTDPLERSIGSMGRIEVIQSKTMADLSLINIELDKTIRPDEVDQQWDRLRRKVADFAPHLPSGASQPVVMDDFGDLYGIFLAMIYDGYTEQEIREYALRVQRELEGVEGVSRVSIYGLVTPAVEIAMTQNQLALLGMLPTELLPAVHDRNQPIYGGYFESGDKRMRISLSGRYNAIEEIGETMLKGHEGELFRLKEIASVGMGSVEPARNEMRFDGARALGISLSMKQGYDVTKVGKRVELQLTQLNMPAGIEFEKVFFQPDRVEEAMKQFVWNLLLSIVIVVVVLIFTMGWRSGIVIGTGLLITVLGSVLLLSLLNGTLQRVSLGAFIIAMGMLVDNAIVVVDGILMDRKRGVKGSLLLTNSADKTATPLLGATLIAILAFLPIFLSPDTAGIYVRDLFVVLAVSLLLSWLLALTQVPIQSDHFLNLSTETKEEADPDALFRTLFKRFITLLLSHKRIAIAVIVALLLGGIWGFQYVKQGFFPNMAYDQLYIEYRLEEGETTRAVAIDLAEIEQLLLAKSEVRHVTSSIGATPTRYNLVRTISEPGLNYGELIVDFTSPRHLERSIDAIQQELEERYPQASVRVKRYNLMYMSYPVELMFKGSDPAELKRLMIQAKQLMEQQTGVIGITDDWSASTPTLQVSFDPIKAAQASYSRSEVGFSLLAATYGVPVATYYDGREMIPVLFRTTNQQGTPYQALDNLPIWRSTPSLNGWREGKLSTSVPLSLLSDSLTLAWEEPVVRRHNRQRAIKVQCDVKPGFTPEEVRRALQRAIVQMELPEGYTMQWLGEYDASQSAKYYLFGKVPLAVVLILLILIALFKDFKRPLIILFSLPLASIGIVIAMLLSGKEFGFVAIVGALGLIGMLIKNGVVLIDEITLLIAEGMEPSKALIEASMLRFRPVMMASITTILGMIPLVWDDMFGSMAVTIMGGLFVGTLITLAVIPLFYAILFNIQTDSNTQTDLLT